MTASTPTEITDSVTSFCKTVNPKCNLDWVPVVPNDESKAGECFYNVKDHVQSSGGKLAFGWAIWLWPSVYIEAEHHAVWKTDDGELVDITPKQDGEEKILFLHDEKASYFFPKPKWRTNIQRSLKSNAVVDDFLTACAKVKKYEFRHSHMDGRQRITRFSTQAKVNQFKKLKGLRDAASKNFKASLCS